MIVATAAVAAGAVILALAVLTGRVMVLVRETNAANQALVRMVLDGQLEQEREHRAERAMLARALIAKNTGELAHLERIENAVRKAEVQANAADVGRRMTPAEYEAWMRQDLEAMGEDPSRVPSVAPPTPEGL